VLSGDLDGLIAKENMKLGLFTLSFLGKRSFSPQTISQDQQTILEDGREITAAHSVFSSDFSHGWESNGMDSFLSLLTTL
jgi:hypothetical protein